MGVEEEKEEDEGGKEGGGDDDKVVQGVVEEEENGMHPMVDFDRFVILPVNLRGLLVGVGDEVDKGGTGGVEAVHGGEGEGDLEMARSEVTGDDEGIGILGLRDDDDDDEVEARVVVVGRGGGCC